MKPAVMSTIRLTPSPSRTPTGSFGSLSRYRSLRHDECGDDRRSLPGEPSGRPSQHTPQPVRGGAQTTPGVQPRAELTLESGRTTPMPNANGSRSFSRRDKVLDAPAVHPLVGDNRAERVQPGGAVAHRVVLCEHVALALVRPLAVKVAARLEVDGPARRLQVHQAQRVPVAALARWEDARRERRERRLAARGAHNEPLGGVCHNETSSPRRCPQAHKRSSGASAEFPAMAAISSGGSDTGNSRATTHARAHAAAYAGFRSGPVGGGEPLQLRLRRLAVLALVRVVGIGVDVFVVAELDELLEEPVRHVHESCAERGGRSPRAVRAISDFARASRAILRRECRSRS